MGFAFAGLFWVWGCQIFEVVLSLYMVNTIATGKITDRFNSSGELFGDR